MNESDLALEARRLYMYDPFTGVFSWAAKRRGARIGQAIECRSRGYVVVRLGGRQYGAHRIAWLVMNGRWPMGQIDHIDGNRSNNAIANLRDVSHASNQHNRKRPQRNNRAGALGVFRNGREVSYTARIALNGRSFRIGSFASAEQAHAAYVNAKRKLHEAGTL